MKYQPGDDILIFTDSPTTLQDCGIGPFLITQVHISRNIANQYTPYMVHLIRAEWETMLVH